MDSDGFVEIFINHQGQQTGPFTPQQIQTGLASGQYQTSDLIWYQGLDGWIPLSQAHQIYSATAPLPTGTHTETSGLAITSLACGISSLMCGITGIPAVICGHIARRNIKASQGRIDGSGIALAGIITGYIGCAVIMIALLAGLTAPLIIRQRKKADQTEAMSNAKSFGLSLYEFEADYGSFPNASTAPIVAEKSSTPEITGSSSNDRFRQLIRSGITQSEFMFYAKTGSTRKPDGNISGNQAIAPGECGFAYVDNLNPADRSSRPIAMAPFIHGTTEFDLKPFANKAVILWTDNSVTALPINSTSGKAKSILNPDNHVWNGTPPILLMPE